MKRLPFPPLATSGWLLMVIIFNGCWCHDPDVLVSLHDETSEPVPLQGEPPTSVIPGDGDEGDGEDGGTIAGECVDLDGDGYGVGPGCLGPDCDDGDVGLSENGERRCYGGPQNTAGIGACTEGIQRCVDGVLSACEGEVQPEEEVCDAVDNDCNGEVDEALVRTCYGGPEGTQGVGACVAGTQTCTAGVYGACEGETLPQGESCDAVDNDCDGEIDEALVRSCYGGPAGTEGVGVCTGGMQTCTAGSYGACSGQVTPGSETCDALDNDCDGEVDEAIVRSCYSGPPGTEGVGSCGGGMQTCTAGSFGACEGESLPSTETCDAVDNDCDGEVDEALVRSCFGGPAESLGIGVCAGGTQTCTAGSYGACEGEVQPGTETCDGLDNDCDGEVDEALVRSCYGGPEGTEGVGICTGGTQTCTAGTYGACEGEVQPGGETCDAVDNDCDGEVDEALTRTCYSGPEGTEDVGACYGGIQTCVAGEFGTCDGESLPSAETCDAIDNDCNGQVDEALTRSCYGGPDGTAGVGTCSAGSATCEFGTWGSCEGDVQPEAETCDAADNDCDGATDEDIIRACYSGPTGTEANGVCARGTQTCDSGTFGACEGEVLPSDEVCDALDNDCDGTIDESLVRSCYPGPSGTEDVGLCSPGSEVCAEGAWGECSGYTLPQTETCDAADNNCDGSTDENVTRVRKDGSSQDSDPVFRPVDIIVVIDNSGSMTDEIVAVENNLNTSFADILDRSGLDYRVILLAKHGRASIDQSICIKSPLSGNGDCTQVTTCPVNGPRFFHYSHEVGSHDSLAVILRTYNAADPCGQAPGGWSDWLRPDAAKFFIEITDDGPTTSAKKANDNSMTADTFESRLFSLTPAMFGDATDRGYVFHSIVGLRENSPRLEPWQPTDPLVTDLCTGNGGDVRQNGLEFQKLSVRSDGLRFPICEYQSFDAIFEAVARGILIGSRLSCVMSVSGVPADSSLENTTLEFTPTNGGQVVPIQQVANEAACTGNSFYVENDQLHLCPDACTLWQNDPTAYIDVLFTCHSQVASSP